MHRGLVGRKRIVDELVDVAKCQCGITCGIVQHVRVDVVNEVGRDVARDVVHFGGGVGPLGRWTGTI